MRFLDEAQIRLKAGSGGDGIVAWRREKYVPNGGPSGGDGGKGGDVIVIGHGGMSSLLDIRNQAEISAKDGQKGGTKNMTGRNGPDALIFVPIGTQIFDLETQELMGDITKDGQKIVICQGGRGGFGNAHFSDPTCQAPQKATFGFEGEERLCRFSLKLMADVGLVGFPNAGKSTLLSRLSNARPKIADYPFTTIRPMIGIVEFQDDKSFVLADVPGLIEGASEGLGLGTRFLRHLERVRLLCHLVDVCSWDKQTFSVDDVFFRYKAICKELCAYDEKLGNLPQVIALTKADTLDGPSRKELNRLRAKFEEMGYGCVIISAVTGEGMPKLLDILGQTLQRCKNKLGESPLPKEFNPTTNLYA